jgi:hemolysin activation/secretion protein
MKLCLLAAVLLAFALLAPVLAAPVAAQEVSPQGDTRLQMETKRKRMVVRPPVAPEQAARDAARVTAEVETRARREALIRELTDARPRRPSLDYDVTSGIQGRNLQKARRP